MQRRGRAWKGWVGSLQRCNASAVTSIFAIQRTAPATAARAQDDRWGGREGNPAAASPRSGAAAWEEALCRATGSNVTAPPRPGDGAVHARKGRTLALSGSAVHAGNGAYRTGWGRVGRAWGDTHSPYSSPAPVRRPGAVCIRRYLPVRLGRLRPSRYRQLRDRVHLVAVTTALLQSLLLLLCALRQAPNHRRALRGAVRAAGYRWLVARRSLLAHAP